MEVWVLVLIIGLIIAATVAFIWLGLNIRLHQSAKDYISGVSSNPAEQVFTTEFREELRNKARQDFDVLVKTHVAELSHQLTELSNELGQPIDQQVKQQVEKLVHQQFSKHQKAVDDSKDSITHATLANQQILENQYKTIKESIEHDLEKQKRQRLEHFENNMAEVINHYMLAAIGNHTESKEQIAQIIRELGTHKEQIAQDIKRG